MPWLQFAVCAIEQGSVGLVRVKERSSDFNIGTVGDGRFVHGMFLILLVVDRTYFGHDGAVEAGRGHGEVKVCQTDTPRE